MVRDIKQPIDFMNQEVPAGRAHVEISLIEATAENFADYGTLVTDFMNHPVPITRWPQPGWRPVDPGTGDEAGHVDEIFEFWWEGDVLFGENTAVKHKFALGWSTDPAKARTDNPAPDRDKLLIWHANYHPDGGQLFYPFDNKPFVTALAKTGDDMRPDDWVGFYCDGSFGAGLHAGIWHEAIIPLSPLARFYDKQGAVHARISADFPKEFGVLLSIPLIPPGAADI